MGGDFNAFSDLVLVVFQYLSSYLARRENRTASICQLTIVILTRPVYLRYFLLVKTSNLIYVMIRWAGCKVGSGCGKVEAEAWLCEGMESLDGILSPSPSWSSAAYSVWSSTFGCMLRLPLKGINRQSNQSFGLRLKANEIVAKAEIHQLWVCK